MENIKEDFLKKPSNNKKKLTMFWMFCFHVLFQLSHAEVDHVTVLTLHLPVDVLRFYVCDVNGLNNNENYVFSGS